MSVGAPERSLLLHVRVTPKGGGDSIVGFRTGADGKRHLAVRVSAPPRDGEANESVRRLVAKAVGVSRGSISIVSGERGREKTLKIDGDPEKLKAWVETIEAGRNA